MQIDRNGARNIGRVIAGIFDRPGNIARCETGGIYSDRQDQTVAGINITDSCPAGQIKKPYIRAAIYACAGKERPIKKIYIPNGILRQSLDAQSRKYVRYGTDY